MKKDPLKHSNPKFNAWRLVSDEKIKYSPDAAKAALEARSLLERVIDEHPGSPWALLAQRSINTPFGFKWVETYVPPAVPETPDAAEASQKQRAWLDLAEDLARQNQWEKVRGVLDQAGDPRRGMTEEATFWQRRGDLFAMLNSWDRAAVHYGEVVRLRPDDAVVGCRHVPALLTAGEGATAIRTASGMLNRFRETPNPQDAADVAWCCILALGTVTDRAARMQIAATIVDYYAEDSGTCVRKNALIGALYRVGRCRDAIELFKDWTGPNKPDVQAIWAMAHDRLGHRAEALQYVGGLPYNVRLGTTSELNLGWHDLEFRLLRSEAQALIIYDPVFSADPFAR